MPETHIDRFGPELKLLIACCQNPLEDADASKIGILTRESINSQDFLRMVTRHKVQSLVYRNVGRQLKSCFPAEVSAELKKQFEINRHHSLLLTVELVRLAKWLEENHIRMMVLKGPPLALKVYGDVAMRCSVDLDLLVDRPDIEKTMSLLLSDGYQRMSPDFVLSPRQKKSFEFAGAHYTFYHPERRIHIELHWKFSPNPYMFRVDDIPDILAQSEIIKIAGINIRTASSQDGLLYLFAHGAKHEWAQLSWICDICGWIRQSPPSNWDALVARANRYGLQRPLAQGMSVAYLLFDLPVPVEVRRLIDRDQGIPALVETALDALEKSQEHRVEAPGNLQILRAAFYNMRLKRGLKYQWYCLVDAFQEPRDWKEFPLPEWLFPLYGVLRPFLWFRRYH